MKVDMLLNKETKKAKKIIYWVKQHKKFVELE